MDRLWQLLREQAWTCQDRCANLTRYCLSRNSVRNQHYSCIKDRDTEPVCLLNRVFTPPAMYNNSNLSYSNQRFSIQDSRRSACYLKSTVHSVHYSSLEELFLSHTDHVFNYQSTDTEIRYIIVPLACVGVTDMLDVYSH